MITLKLLVGLGNPGKKYSETRHNVGFRAIKRIADFFDFDKPFFELNALISRGDIEDEKIILAQPYSYMNNSGKVVKNLMDYYKLSLNQLIIIYDDLDLPVGKIRIKIKGSSGGHNGIKSIINNLTTKEFSRIRIGIGRPPQNINTVSHVLDYFNTEEEKEIEIAVKDLVKAVKVICNDGLDRAMNEFN